MLLQLYIFYCLAILCSTRNHTQKLPNLFILMQHQVFFDIFWFKIPIFSQYLFSIENDGSTVAEIGWAFCNNAKVFGRIIKFAQFIIASKS